MLPIIKAPCVLVAMVGLHVVVTPPEPPPTEDETAKSTMLEFLLKQRLVPFFVKVSCIQHSATL
jgi:hypothetical protein